MSSVVIKSIDRDQIEKAVASFAMDTRRKFPEIKRVIWFGSWINGLPTPGSDVDICLIIPSSEEPIRNRISKYLPLGFPVGIDLFAYTEIEFERLKTVSPNWYEAINSGRDI